MSVACVFLLSLLVSMWSAFEHIPIIQHPELLKISFSGIFDVWHHFLVHFGDSGVSKDIEAKDKLQAIGPRH